jgi:carboxylesterase
MPDPFSTSVSSSQMRDSRFASTLGLTLALVACAHPQPSIAPEPAPIPAAIEYDTAVARVVARQTADDSVVAYGGRSLLMTHGARAPRVYVLLHGFTDSPEQFETLGRRLFAGGDNVYIPRLPHHAERVAPVRTLGRVRATELAQFADSVIDVARGLGDTVIVAGLSAGGAIAAHAAQTRREVRRVVLIAPAIAAGVLSEREEHAVVAIAARLPEVTRSEKPDTTHPDFVQGLSTHGLAEVLRLGQRVRQRAEEGPPAAPEMIFLLNELDHTVSEDASLALAKSWQEHNAHVVVYRFPKSLNLPHNVLAIADRGGNPDVVLPVIEALVRSTPPPTAVELQAGPCSGFRCALWRVLRG